MAWSVWSVDTVTGAKLSRLPVSAFSWQRVLNGGGSGSATVPWTDTSVQRLNLDDITKEVSRTLVLDWDGVVVYAGLITNTVWNVTEGTYTITHADLWWLLSRRFAIDFTVLDSNDIIQTYTNLTLGTLVKRAVQLGTTGLADDNASLPISYLGDATGSTGVRKYYGYHFPTVVEVIEGLIEETDGPDVDFQPRWVSGSLNWLLRTGAPKLTEGSYEWNMTADKPGIDSLKVITDAAKTINAAYALGEGQGVDAHYRSNRIHNPELPTLHRKDAYPQESNDDVLISRANAALATYGAATVQWSASMIPGDVSVSDLRLGGTAKFFMPKGPKVAAGWHTNRIVGFSGDLSPSVKLELQKGA